MFNNLDENRDYFNREQASQYLGIGLNLLDDYRKRDLLKYFKLGRRIIISKAACHELLANLSEN